MMDNKSFINRISVRKSNTTEDIVRRLKCNDINIRDLNRTQKKEVYLCLQKEVTRKRNKLNRLKNMVLYKRAQKHNICTKNKWKILGGKNERDIICNRKCIESC